TRARRLARRQAPRLRAPRRERHARHMGGLARLFALTLLAANAAAVAACGDPVVVLGDQPGIMRIVAGVPEVADNATGTPATRTPLVQPRALAVGADGVLYVGARREVHAITSTGELRTLVDDDVCSGTPCLERVESMALTGDGRLILADALEHRLLELDLVTGARRVIAGTGSAGFSADGALAETAALGGPASVVVLPDGRIVFSERTNHRIRSIEPDGTLATVAGTGIPGSIGDGGAAKDARLTNPAGLALAGDVLYIADTGNNRIRAVHLALGRIDGVAGVGDAGFGGDGGTAMAAHLRNPTAVAVSPDGRTLYIADTGNNRVRAVDLLRGTINTFAGTGDVQFTGDLLPAGETALDSPGGITVSPHGLLFIA